MATGLPIIFLLPGRPAARKKALGRPCFQGLSHLFPKDGSARIGPIRDRGAPATLSGAATGSGRGREQ